MEQIFYIVDVFAESKYAGNQLSVVRHAGNLTELEMQQIAIEMNYSETTFILSDEARDGGFDVRIFTPQEEVPFAGHPTLGTAHVIRRELLGGVSSTVTLNLKAGKVPVTFARREDGKEEAVMRQLPPEFGSTFSRAELAEILQIDESNIDDRYPIQEVSTGLAAMIVPLKTLDAVKTCRVHWEKYMKLVRKTNAKPILVFAPQTIRPENDLHVRVFVDYLGIPEDPATGSANGCLAGYLVKHRYFDQPSINVRVEQGFAVARPSLLRLQAEEEGDEIRIWVGGRVIDIARGVLVD
ncbi:PhzF family phenazine biosynthesis isomerase [Heliobacillus mobilis]|uniref:PhzF family phenazine biosynthesis isomerase n=1 Tax=Heliobacterium mobile TaxID=28064 RepID=A0A6I3SPB8_HELMO|nr:PhzF family phenazine biosynthesis protein [Heliobacterium mobile]MTV50871.1 PhzF family phenazine biosynthesis isomerase [Heliobacterium mobile]